MDRAYQKFLRQGIDLASIGIERQEDNTPYFCTPKGASVIGWAGVDGIHFCFIRGFGGMVFSVSPMNIAPNYVHPLAKDFGDFLRLILACGDAAALEQAWMWDERQFEAFLQENPLTQEQQQTLSEISEKMELTPMEKPWAYMKALQSDFDYGKIKYTEDYYDMDMNPAAEPALPEWKVYFDGGFWGHSGRDHAGKEIRLNTQFDWAERHWLIPAAYSCSKGLVLDFCMQVDPEEIRKFMIKWNLNWENDSAQNFSREQQMQMECDNPLDLPFNSSLMVNGKALRNSHGCSVSFNPCLPDGITNDQEAIWVMNHYGLDDSYGWVISRKAFLWESKRRPEIKSLSLTIEQQPGRVPGPHFTVHRPGDSFTFTHPVSGKTYTLTVQKLEKQILPQNSFGSPYLVYPNHYIAMDYTLSPEPEEEIMILDCGESDRPMARSQVGKPARFIPDNTCCIGIIGGADGPTALVFGGSSQGKLHAACSALHFEPIQKDVAWRMVFHIKQFDEMSLSLLS